MSAPWRPRRAKPARPLGEVSGLTVRLRAEWLHAAPLDGLRRLAVALGLSVERSEDDTDGSYRHRLTKAIQRREAELARGAS